MNWDYCENLAQCGMHKVNGHNDKIDDLKSYE